MMAREAHIDFFVEIVSVFGTGMNENMSRSSKSFFQKETF